MVFGNPYRVNKAERFQLPLAKLDFYIFRVNYRELDRHLSALLNDSVDIAVKIKRT